MITTLRQLALSKQGLGATHQFGEGLSGTRRAIEHLGYVQIDTLSVVARAHHHVLWNRVPGYDLEHLNQLIRAGHIVEYWYHAASYLPISDYRYLLPQMAAIRNGEHRYFSNGDKTLMNEILARIKSEGPMRLRDMDKGNKSKGDWWNSRPGRHAVASLFMQGDLMVCARNGMEKIYDLTERCLPKQVDLTVPTLSEYAAYLFETTLRAHGVFTWQQLLHLKVGRPLRDAMRTILDERIDAGTVAVFDNINGLTMYVDASALDQEAVIDPGVKILSPFDNLIIHRDRITALFQFDYRIECYVPASKRVFGYFCLPILYADRLIGRMDCKAHRSEQRFEVLHLSLEEGAGDLDLLLPALSKTLQQFALFNHCPILDATAITQMYAQ